MIKYIRVIQRFNPVFSDAINNASKKNTTPFRLLFLNNPLGKRIRTDDPLLAIRRGGLAS